VRLEAVRRQVLAHRLSGIRVLAPTHEQAHDVVRHVLADVPASLGVERAGWIGFGVRLATPALIARGLTPVSGLGFEAIVARVVARARETGSLTYFADASRHPGFVPALARTLGEVRRAAVPAASLDDGTAKGRDLASLLAAVEAAMGELRHADRADVLALATEAVQRDEGSDLTLPLVLVDPPLTSRRDVALAQALLARSRDGLVAAPEGDPWVQHLFDGLATSRDEIDPATHATTPDALRRVHVGLFTSSDAVFRPAAADSSVECLSAPGEGRECAEVARVVLAHAERGTRFDRMAVVMRAPELYASHLETALRRADVPACFGRGTRRPDPAGRAMLALLACAVEDLSARRFAEYLSLGQVPSVGRDRSPLSALKPAGEDGRRPTTTPPGVADGPLGERSLPALVSDEAEALGLLVTDEATLSDGGDGSHASADAAVEADGYRATSGRSPWRWEAILNDAQVIGGADRWDRRLRGHREHLKVRADAAFTDDPSSPRHEFLTRQVTWTDELIAFAGDIVGEMASWPAVDDWGGWIARLHRLTPRVLASPDRVLATLAELQPLAGIGGVRLAEVCDVLRDRLTHLSVPPPAHRYGRVFVGTPDQVRGRAFDVVCVLGLSERVFPQRSRQDPLLLDRERERLSPDLATDEMRVGSERLQLRLAVGAASQALVVSYASMETAQARPRVPSFYAIDVQRAVTGRVPGYEVLMREAQQRSGARLAWPAPHEPASAIDAAEHDLSMLQRYLRGPGADIDGRARYLFDLNPALRRALVARHQRLSRAWTSHDGLVVPPDVLAKHRLQARAYSASALQRFAICPYQFYLSTVLRLEPREEAVPHTTLDPLTRGSMVHEMLADIMRAFIARGWAPLTDASLEQAQAVADDLVTRVAGEYEDRLRPPILRVWQDAVGAIRRDIHEWVRRLPADGGHWTPARVEIGVGFAGGFGRDDASQREEAVLPDGTRMHGVVDLLERGAGDEGRASDEGRAGSPPALPKPSGEGGSPAQWRITDYKTGRYRLAANVVVNGGRTLQPILYAMAVEAAFGGRVTASRLYYCTDEGGFEEHPWAITGASGEATRKTGLEVLAIIDHAIQEGRLPAAPSEDACHWCDFAAVCGPSAQSLPRRKDSRALAELTLLRRMK
jgi:CRISPR/Cas system-associated exonuclease Cas4 (RecB family)